MRRFSLLSALFLLAAPLLAGCGTMLAAQPLEPTFTVSASERATYAAQVEFDKGGPSVSWEEQYYTVTVHSLAADPNLVVLGFTVYDKTLTPDENKKVTWMGSVPDGLTTAEGNTLAPLEKAFGWNWSPNGSSDSIVRGSKAAFDAAGLTTVSNTLSLHLVADFNLETINAWTGVYKFTPSPQPTIKHPTPFHVDRVITIPFDPRRRIAEPHLSVEGRGITLTLERVQVTASETRMYMSGQVPSSVGGNGPQLSGSGWALDISYSGFKYVSGVRDSKTGQEAYRLGASLLDKPGPWVLTLPALTKLLPPGAVAQHGDWMGPWRFRFALPDASASLTPGPMPSMPPATPWPTDAPGAEPTFIGPLTGPVPPTDVP